MTTTTIDKAAIIKKVADGTVLTDDEKKWFDTFFSGSTLQPLEQGVSTGHVDIKYGNNGEPQIGESNQNVRGKINGFQENAGIIYGSNNDFAGQVYVLGNDNVAMVHSNEEGIAIGYQNSMIANGGIGIGMYTKVLPTDHENDGYTSNGIAIGKQSLVHSSGIAMGQRAISSADSSVAIGQMAISGSLEATQAYIKALDEPGSFHYAEYLQKKYPNKFGQYDASQTEYQRMDKVDPILFKEYEWWFKKQGIESYDKLIEQFGGGNGGSHSANAIMDNFGWKYALTQEPLAGTTAIGVMAKAVNNWATAVGPDATASGQYSLATGLSSLASGENSSAYGRGAKALGTDSLALGYFASAGDTGVAVGAYSNASVAAGVFGYDPLTKKNSTDSTLAWKSTLGAVAVGNSKNTRQITGVAAGTADTDAVNVAQLKKALENAGTGGIGGSTIEIIAGTGIDVKQDGSTYTISSTVTGGAGGSGGPLKFADDTGTEATVNTNETLTIKGDTKNISTKIDGKTLSVKLNDDISVNTIKAKTSVSVENGPSMTANGIDANSKKITHVADGTEKGDAVNYGQLQAVEGRVDTNTQAITSIGSHVDRLDSRMNKVGAGAAALAALHPLEFDTDDKWNFAVGYGNYKDANSIAMGAFYRPNGNTMFSVGTNFGNGENMVNAGVSFKFGQGSNLASRPAMAKKMVALEETVQEQKETIDTLKEKMAALEELVKRQSEVIANMTK